MLALGGVCVDIARINAARSELDSAMGLAMNSLLSQYNRKLYEMYGLFALTLDEEELEDLAGLSLEKSINSYEICSTSDLYARTALKNVFGSGNFADENFSGLVNLTYSYCEAEKAAVSTVANPAVLENQIVEYMKYRGPLAFGKTMAEKFGVLENLGAQCDATAAKLEYNSETATADSLARELYYAYVSYCIALGESPFTEKPVQGLNECADRNYEYSLFLKKCCEYAEKLKELKKTLKTDAKDYDTGDGAAERFLSAYSELLLLNDENCFLEELKEYSGLILLPDNTNIENEDGWKNAQVCTRLADWLVSNSEKLERIFLLTDAVEYYGGKITGSEKALLADSGTDFELICDYEETVSGYCRAIEEKIKVLLSCFADFRLKVSALCDGLIRDFSEHSFIIDDCLTSLAEVSGSLAEKLQESEAKLEIWEDTLDCLEDGEMKESYKAEIDESAQSLSSENVLLLKQDIEEARLFFEAACLDFPYPDESLYEKYVVSSDVFSEGAKHYPLMNRLRELYEKDETTVRDTNILSEIRSLSAELGISDGEDTPEKISEADVYEIFDAIDLLSQTAGEILENARELSLDSSSDKALSDSAGNGITAISSLLSGVSGLLESSGENLLCTEYLTGMFSCASDKNQGNAVSDVSGSALFQGYFYGQELEYLLYGFDSAKANTSAAYAEIYAIRFALNLVYAYTDTAIKAEALELASVLAGWCGFGIPLVQNVIIIAWAAAESAMDMNRLLDGKKVAVYKNGETRSLSVAGILDLLTDEGTEKKDDDGLLSLGYKDYLTLFMLIRYPLNKNAILGRCAKLIQINVGSADPDFNVCEAQTVVTIECYALVETAFTDILETDESLKDTVSMIDLNNIGSTLYGIEGKKTAAY